MDIKPVRTRSDLKRFVKFPWTIYGKDPNWVPPLIHDRMNFLSANKNPYFRHSEVKLILAYRDGELAGTLSVHENKPHVKAHGENVGFFGFFECIYDHEVSRSLFDHAAGWLREKGYEIMRGPANFSINGEYSLLVKGFDSSPVIMMTYNPRYYVKLVEDFGFMKSQDMYAFQMFSNEGIPEVVRERAAEVEKERKDVIIRKMNMKDFDNEVRLVHKIYTSAWSENWGAVPMTEREFFHIAKELKLVLDPDIAYLAELNGEPIGFSLSIPDMNTALRAANGRLFPFGLLKILLAKRRIDGIRVLIMGVLKEYRHQGIDTVFYKRTYEESMRKGYLKAEMSLINESNKPMIKVLKNIGARIYKTYRMYDYRL